jgi:hypothetical protein
MMGPIIIGGGGGGPGTPGASPEFQKTATHIQWRLAGANEWFDLVSIADLIGPAGEDGTDGVSPELQKTATYVQWRLPGGSWANLVSLAELTGPAGASGQLVLKGSVQLTANNAAYNIAGAAPAGATHVVVEAIGGGASGMALGSTPNSAAGGMPGAAERTDMLPLSSIPATVAVTIGAGGVGYTSTGTLAAQSANNAGGETRVGDLVRAVGGASNGGFATAVSALLFFASSKMPSMPGWHEVANILNGRHAFGGADGPGGGGASGPGHNGTGYGNGIGGNGGEGGRRVPGFTTAGGIGVSAAAGPAGSNAATLFSYGGGGAGGGSSAASGFNGGAGGFPGGGGGGAGRGATSGAGAAGAVRLFFYGAP